MPRAARMEAAAQGIELRPAQALNRPLQHGHDRRPDRCETSRPFPEGRRACLTSRKVVRRRCVDLAASAILLLLVRSAAFTWIRARCRHTISPIRTSPTPLSARGRACWSGDDRQRGYSPSIPSSGHRKTGKPPVTNVWLWGQGSAPKLEPFEEALYRVRGTMITAVDLLRACPTDRLDADRRAGGDRLFGHLRGQGAGAAIRQLKNYTTVCVHVRRPTKQHSLLPTPDQALNITAISSHPRIRGLAGQSSMADPGLARSPR